MKQLVIGKSVTNEMIYAYNPKISVATVVAPYQDTMIDKTQNVYYILEFPDTEAPPAICKEIKKYDLEDGDSKPEVQPEVVL